MVKIRIRKSFWISESNKKTDKIKKERDQEKFKAEKSKMGLKFGARCRYREGHFLASRVRGIRLLPRERDNKGRYNYLAFP